MYRAMIVDDEWWIVRGLERLLDWNTYGFELVAGLTDSEETLRLAENVKPDLLISDIRMAGLDGIELMRKTKEANPRMKHIMISGYSDFHYAREALRHGALDYILKPVTTEALGEALLKAKTQLDEETARARAEHPEIEPVLQFLKSVGVKDVSDMALGKLGLKGTHPYYRCFMISEGARKEEWLALLPPASEASAFTCGRKRLLFVVNYAEGAETELMEKWRNEAVRTGRRVGASGRATSVCAVPELTEQAKQAFLHDFIDAREPFCEYRDEPLPPLSILMEKLDPLLKGDPQVDRIHELIDQLPEFVSRHRLTMKSLTILYNYLIGAINKTLISRATPDDELWTAVDAAKLAEDYGTMERFQLHLHDYVNRLAQPADGSADAAPAAPSLSHRTLIARVKRYIDENYQSNLSLNDLEETFFLDGRYISRLFKQETGQTFTSYLTEVRMNHARALLGNTGLSIQAVAELCGYRDYFYFNKLFKKHVGVTPASFRKSAVK